MFFIMISLVRRARNNNYFNVQHFFTVTSATLDLSEYCVSDTSKLHLELHLLVCNQIKICVLYNTCQHTNKNITSTAVI